MSHWFHAAARVEHLDHVAFYESRQAGLGARYLADFESALEFICEAPHRVGIKRKPDIRGYHLGKFPFTILFREVAGGIHILAIAHDRRRPSYWVARI